MFAKRTISPPNLEKEDTIMILPTDKDLADLRWREDLSTAGTPSPPKEGPPPTGLEPNWLTL